MKKQIALLLSMSLIVVLLSTPVLAYDNSSGNSCIKDELPDEIREQFTEIINQFRTRMEIIREKMHAYRDNEEREAFLSQKDLRDEIKVERYEAIIEILPEELAERFSERGRGLHHFIRDNKNNSYRERSR